MSSMHCGQVREQVGDFDAALAVPLEGALGAEQARFGVDELILGLAETLRPLLAVQLVEQRLGIERVHLAGAAGQEQEHHRLSLWPSCAAAWEPADCSSPRARCSCCSMAPNASAPNAAAGVAEELAAISGDAGMFGHRILWHL